MLRRQKYDFKPFLKRILVKQYGTWSEYFAPNKTKLRKCLYGRIDEMVYLNQSFGRLETDTQAQSVGALEFQCSRCINNLNRNNYENN